MDTDDEDREVVPSSLVSSSSSPLLSSEEEEEAEMKAPSTPAAPVKEECEVAQLEAEEAVTTITAAQDNLRRLSPKGIKGYHFIHICSFTRHSRLKGLGITTTTTNNNIYHTFHLSTYEYVSLW